jgi:hypothetical protein
VIDGDDLVFAWAIGKALLIVAVSLGALLYLAWAVTRQRKHEAQVAISKLGALKRKSPAKADRVVLITDATSADNERRSLSG